ncbi:Ctr copper transporter [Phytophthora cinnamomi]|uniref:Ctr copper transporter n=1 Tax=Phytophthora cinnamomi TaxID=4785 RepID=UPI00355A5E7A|nr:Ctr copper transporter [Phytophthora cinnamomi]
MERGGFCMGPGSLMGTAGFKWAGRDTMADCSMLWLESWGLTSVSRAAAACLLVFLLAALSQYLTTANGCQLQQSKAFAKRRLALAQAQRATGSSSGQGNFYDPELGHRRSSCERSKDCKHADESAVHPERPELLQAQDNKSATLSTAERAHPTSASASLPARPAPPTSVKVGNWTHLGDALMRGVRILLAYLLMLVVMTYDLTLITSIVLGFMTSFFVFGKDTAKVPVSADPCCS